MVTCAQFIGHGVHVACSVLLIRACVWPPGGRSSYYGALRAGADCFPNCSKQHGGMHRSTNSAGGMGNPEYPIRNAQSGMRGGGGRGGAFSRLIEIRVQYIRIYVKWARAAQSERAAAFD